MEKALMVVKWGILQRRIIFWMVLKLLWEWIFWLILLFVYLNSDVMGLYSCKEFMRTRNRLSVFFFFLLHSEQQGDKPQLQCMNCSFIYFFLWANQVRNILGVFSIKTCFCVNEKWFHKNVLIPKYKRNVSRVKLGFGEQGRNSEKVLSHDGIY